VTLVAAFIHSSTTFLSHATKYSIYKKRVTQVAKKI